MSKPHILEIHLTDGQVHRYKFASVTEIDTVRNRLLKEMSESSIFTIVNEDDVLKIYPLNNVLMITINNLQEWVTRPPSVVNARELD